MYILRVDDKLVQEKKSIKKMHVPFFFFYYTILKTILK